MIKRIDVYRCKTCARLEFKEHEKILLGFMKKCPFCGDEMVTSPKECIYQIENKKGVL